MELPDSIKAIGEQIATGDDINPAAELFEAYDVFAAELAQIFTRPWLAVDHASRLKEDGDFLRFDVGSRSVVLVREKEDCIHALRNACLHAGYRVCEEETGRTQQLYCQYHGWFYALDGLLTEPMLQPKITDRSRFRLARYGMQITNGLIFVDLSKVGPTAPETEAVPLSGLPDDIGQRTPGRRKRYKTTINWKKLRQFVWAAPEMAFGADSCDKVVEYGPLSMIAVRNGDASLIRLIPRYPGQTEIDVVPLPANAGDRGNDKIGDALRDNNDAVAAAPLNRAFYDWYWPQLAPVAAA